MTALNHYEIFCILDFVISYYILGIQPVTSV